MSTDSLTAVTRFGLGPKPGEINAIGSDPRGYVAAQCDAAEAALIAEGTLTPVDDAAAMYKTISAELQRAREAVKVLSTDASRAALEAAKNERRRYTSGRLNAELAARYAHGASTEHPFVERLVLFWSNHFAINTTANIQSRFAGPSFEREAIRPHVFGRFRDLLMAATVHPAMLNYLNNAASVGPNSPRAKRAWQRANRRLDINENHGRELLELHSLGVDGGYTQADVIETAKIMTGWIGPVRTGAFAGLYQERTHEPGARTVLGVTYPDAGSEQLEWLIDDLSVHEATAFFVCGKLARHFAGDGASDELVAHLAGVFLDTGGDLGRVSAALVAQEEVWAPGPRKLVPPYDFIVACGRLLGGKALGGALLRRMMHALAQPVWRTPSPAGWPDTNDAFSGGDAFLERVDAAKMIAQRFGRRNVPRLAERVFGDTLEPEVRQAVSRAETAHQALVLLFMSPVLHRR